MIQKRKQTNVLNTYEQQVEMSVMLKKPATNQ